MVPSACASCQNSLCGRAFATMSMFCLIFQEILQRSVSVEDQRQGLSSSRAQSKTTLNELLDTLKLLEEEPERLSAPKCYHKDKYAWIDEVRPSHL